MLNPTLCHHWLLQIFVCLFRATSRNSVARFIRLFFTVISLNSCRFRGFVLHDTTKGDMRSIWKETRIAKPTLQRSNSSRDQVAMPYCERIITKPTLQGSTSCWDQVAMPYCERMVTKPTSQRSTSCWDQVAMLYCGRMW